ncbi:MAG TPA: arginase family protein [Polyangiaceae bacterium]|nr:arginase family protein [Polyangiaceae bacterium]
MKPSVLEELSWLLRPAGGGVYLVSTGRREQQALQRRFYEAETEADVSRRFLESLERIATARVVLLGVPSDVGAGFRRGANLGPQALRTRLLDTDRDFPRSCADRGILDIGDVFVVPQLLDDEMLSSEQLARCRAALYPDVPTARRAELPVSPLSIAARVLSLILAEVPGVKPFILGGDHSCAWPAVKALHDAGRRFCIVQPDAHTDLLPERLGIRMCFATWTFHANQLLGKQGRVIQVGIRASGRPKEHWEETLGVKQFWADEILTAPDRALDAVIAAARATGRQVYLSNDVDGTDAAVADACGTPEPDGLSREWLLELIRRLGSELGLVGADLMEVAPLLGEDGGAKTLALGVEYVRASLDALIASESS